MDNVKGERRILTWLLVEGPKQNSHQEKRHDEREVREPERISERRLR